MLNTFATFLYLVIYFVLFLRRKKMCDANIYSILFLSVSGFFRKPNRRRPKTLRNSLNKFCICFCVQKKNSLSLYNYFIAIRTFSYRTLTSEMLVTVTGYPYGFLATPASTGGPSGALYFIKQVSIGLYICVLYKYL